jgi:hypothetical protein
MSQYGAPDVAGHCLTLPGAFNPCAQSVSMVLWSIATLSRLPTAHKRDKDRAPRSCDSSLERGRQGPQKNPDDAPCARDSASERTYEAIYSAQPSRRASGSPFERPLEPTIHGSHMSKERAPPERARETPPLPAMVPEHGVPRAAAAATAASRHGRGVRSRGAVGRLISRLLGVLPQCSPAFSPQVIHVVCGNSSGG